MILETDIENLIVRTSFKNDAYEIYNLIQNSAEHLIQFGDYTDLVEKSLDGIKNDLENPKDDHQDFEIIFSNSIIGWISLIKHEEQVYGLGYWLGKDFIRKGYMRAALDSVIKYAFQECNALELWAGIKAENISSINLVRKLGFKLVRTQKTHVSYRLTCL